MVERTRANAIDLKPERIAADVAYGTGEMLGWLVARDIDPHIPVWDRSKAAARKDGKFTRGRTSRSIDRERDVYICPGRETIAQNHRYGIHGGKTLQVQSPSNGD